jgi:hypothetical protein
MQPPGERFAIVANDPWQIVGEIGRPTEDDVVWHAKMARDSAGGIVLVEGAVIAGVSECECVGLSPEELYKTPQYQGGIYAAR